MTSEQLQNDWPSTVSQGTWRNLLKKRNYVAAQYPDQDISSLVANVIRVHSGVFQPMCLSAAKSMQSGRTAAH